MLVARRRSLARLLFGALAPLFFAAALAACQSAGETLGIAKSLPDEYAVSVGPNLAVPPDIELRPPLEGEASVVDDAASIVFGTDGAPGAVPAATITPTNLSAGEYALLEQADAITRNAAIRTILGGSPTGEALPDLSSPTLEPGDAATTALEPAVPAPDPEVDTVIDDFFQELMFWEGADRQAAIADDAIIDPAREAARLEENAAAGKPTTEGATPILLDGEPTTIEAAP